MDREEKRFQDGACSYPKVGEEETNRKEKIQPEGERKTRKPEQFLPGV